MIGMGLIAVMKEVVMQDLQEWAEARAKWWDREALASEIDGMHQLAANCRRIAEDYRQGRILPPRKEG